MQIEKYICILKKCPYNGYCELRKFTLFNNHIGNKHYEKIKSSGHFKGTIRVKK